MWVEADGWLVHNNDLGIAEKSIGDAHALAEAFGEGPDDFAACGAGQVADFHGTFYAGANLASGHLLEAGAEAEILHHPHVVGQGIVFRHIADLALYLVGVLGDADAVDPG